MEAGGGSDLNCRMFTGHQNPEDQNPEEQFFYDFIFRLFKENKVEIASAITKPFPFLMGLRDRGFIPEQKYEYFQEAYRNLVPVERVAYDVLGELEKTFDTTVLDALFSKVNLEAYPDLLMVCRSFQNVIYDNFHDQIIDDEDTKEMLNFQLSCEQGDTLPKARIPKLLHDGHPPSIREEVSSHGPNSRVQTQEMTNGCAQESQQSEDGNACGESCDGEEPQEASSSSLRCGPVSCDPEAPRAIKEQPEEEPSHQRCDEGEGSSICSGICDEDDPKATLSSLTESGPVSDELDAPLKNRKGKSEELTSSSLPCDGQGAELQAQRREKCSCVICFSKDVPEGLEESTKDSHACNNTDIVSPGNNSTLGKHKKKRRPRIPRDKSVDFHSEILPVTCGEMKGMLHKNKLKQGSSVKCISREDGQWFTPREFEVAAGYTKTSVWKMRVRCGGNTLKWLIEKGFLSNPPITYVKRKKTIPEPDCDEPIDPCMGNLDVCEVCWTRGTLFCCDTCSRSFHEQCHIPPVETERNPWSCTFCRMQVFSGSQQCHRESEVLARQMGPEEQLKCEFLLLKVYCHSESAFFEKTPCYYRIKRVSQNLKEPMWLDKIKKRLNEQGYPQVEGFVQDMRLIFQNHRASYKYYNSGLMGRRLEEEFEKNFKEVFAMQEKEENS